jgi:hypothetical protein
VSIKEKFPYYQIHQIVMDSVGWASESCLDQAEWEDCLTTMIDRINFYLWKHFETFENDESENRKWLPDSEHELLEEWREYKNPKTKCIKCESKDVFQNLNICKKCLVNLQVSELKKDILNASKKNNLLENNK